MPARPRLGTPARVRALIAVALLAVGIAVAIQPAGAASSVVTITSNVASATNLTTSGCAPGVAGRTDFGTLLPGTLATTSTDCVVVFGSLNNTASLQLHQSDTFGVGMWKPSGGALDTAFDGDGRATAATAPGAADDYANAAVVQPDGKIVTAGSCSMGGATGFDACLLRYLPNGSLDTSFDTDGRVTTSTGPGANDDHAAAVALQPDGKIITAGRCDMGATGIDACLARYLPSGALDASFDTDGRVSTSTASGLNLDRAHAVAVQPDGRIVTAGSCSMGVTGEDICLWRYNADGSLDTTFDGDGRVVSAPSPGSNYDQATAVTIQEDGKIVVAGQCAIVGSDQCVLRYNIDGSLDTTFDTDGIVSTDFAGGVNKAYAVAMQPDGKIVTAGECYISAATGTDFCLARYNTNGSLDTTFSTDGLASTGVAAGSRVDTAYALQVQPDGKLLVAGSCNMGGATGYDACLARFTSNGSLDTTFDTDGRLTTITASGSREDSANAIALQPDGKIITAGFCDMGAVTGYDACLASYASTGTIQQYTNTISDWDTPSTSLFGACLRSVSTATAAWATDATCPTTDAGHWNAVPTAATTIASTALGVTTGTANLRYGLRTTTSQTPGTYIAPVTFHVTAP